MERYLPVRDFLSAIALLICATSAQAADLPSTQETVVTPSERVASGWEVQVTGYLWATALNGTVGIGNLPNSDVNLTFSDILQNLDGALMGDIFVRNGPWMFLGDVVWASLSDKTNLNIANSPTLKYDQDLLILSAIGGYELPLGVDALDLSLTAGVRYQRLTTELTLQSGTFPISVNRNRTEDWIDPVFGLAMQYDISKHWTLNGLADIGGFGVGSEFTSQGFLTASYNWTDRISTAFGYRALYTNYESGSGSNRFDYEATLHGPFMSVGLHF